MISQMVQRPSQTEICFICIAGSLEVRKYHTSSYILAGTHILYLITPREIEYPFANSLDENREDWATSPRRNKYDEDSYNR